MRRKTGIIISMLLFIITFAADSAYSESYFPLTRENATRAVGDAYALFEKEFPNPNFDVVIVNAETNNPEHWESLEIKSLEDQVWMLGLGWPIDLDDNKNKDKCECKNKDKCEGKNKDKDKCEPEEPSWVVPRRAINDPDVPIYFIFNTDYCNTMNDQALLGSIIHDIGHLWDWSVRYSTDTAIVFWTPLGYPMREKMNDSYLMATKDAAIIPLYESALWVEANFPPQGDIVFTGTFTPEDIRRLIFRSVDFLLLTIPDEPPEELLGSTLWEAYNYLKTH